ncbi:MAG: flagellar protein FlgN [Actinomycetota bacterium]|nr:flagellar protein FlgN [Actinomycetota bacterium]
MSLSDVSNILWRERQLLELLVFKLEEEQLVLAAGRNKWLTHATREVETVLDEIKRVELERSIAVQDLAREMEMSDAPSLSDLATVAPTPWDGIFTEHRRALLELAQEIDSFAKANRDLLQRGQQASRDALLSMGEIDIEAYNASGAVTDRTLAMRLVDRAI